MAEGTESIRQDINTIRGSMTDTIEQIESRVKGTVDTTVENVRRTFDVKQQISDQPWAALGIAVVAGYVLGSMGGSEERFAAPNAAREYDGSPMHKPGIIDDVMGQFGDELNVLKSAAIAVAVNMVRDTIQQNVPQLAKVYQQTQQEHERATSSRPVAPAPYRETVGSHLNGGINS